MVLSFGNSFFEYDALIMYSFDLCAWRSLAQWLAGSLRSLLVDLESAQPRRFGGVQRLFLLLVYDVC